jgi:general secretion pathway protein G
MKKHTTLHARLQKGMTLVEVIVVIAIIAIITSLVAVAVIPRLEASKRDAAKIDISNIMGALKIYYASKGNYPNTATGLQELVSERILERLPKDPWNNPYVYINEGGRPVIVSYGADNAPGGEGNNADISSKDL